MKVSDLKRLIKSGSKDATRYHLCGVHIARKGSVLTASATDGHRAVQETVGSDTLSDQLHDGESILVTADHVKVLNVAVPKFQDIQFLRVDGMIVTHGVTFKIDDVKYPDVSKFFEVDRKFPFQIAFDAELLASLIESLNTENSKRPTCLIEFDLANTGGAMKVSIPHSHSNGILMPMRLGLSPVNDEVVARLKVVDENTRL